MAFPFVASSTMESAPVSKALAQSQGVMQSAPRPMPQVSKAHAQSLGVISINVATFNF